MSNLSNNQFRNVYDFNAAKAVKARTGQAIAMRPSAPDSPSMIKHENEAMAMGNPIPKKKSLIAKGMDALAKGLGLTEY